MLHVRTGRNKGEKLRPAIGWIAVGDVSIGVLFSLGGFAFGGLSLGGISLGLLSSGGLAAGAAQLRGADPRDRPAPPVLEGRAALEAGAVAVAQAGARAAAPAHERLRLQYENLAKQTQAARLGLWFFLASEVLPSAFFFAVCSSSRMTATERRATSPGG